VQSEKGFLISFTFEAGMLHKTKVETKGCFGMFTDVVEKRRLCGMRGKMPLAL
jgi:hypothetical protein